MPRPRAACWRGPRNFYRLADLDENPAVGAIEIHFPLAGVENVRDPQSATAWWCYCMTSAAICLLDEEPLTKWKGDVLS